MATGLYAIHPLNGRKVPIYVANFVIMDYGTGAVMSVPGHDDRDYEFAKKYGIDIIPVIKASKIQMILIYQNTLSLSTVLPATQVNLTE